jgi:hypothetical protein
MCCSFSKTLRTLQSNKGYENKSKSGIDKLIFGMKQMLQLFIGKPDRNYKDEEDNVIFAYNPLKIV